MDESKIQKALQKPEEQEIDLIELAQKVWLIVKCFIRYAVLRQ